MRELDEDHCLQDRLAKTPILNVCNQKSNNERFGPVEKKLLMTEVLRVKQQITSSI